MQSHESYLSDTMEIVAKTYDLSERHAGFATDTLGTINQAMQELESLDTDLTDQEIMEEKRLNLKLKKLCTEIIACSAQIRKLHNDINKPNADVGAIAKKMADICFEQSKKSAEIAERVFNENYRGPEDEKCCCCCSLM